MATDSTSAYTRSPAASRKLTGSSTVWDSVKTVLKPLASLKITVCLFALSALLVLMGTLALDKQGMWEVVGGYFRASLLPPNFGFVWVEAKTFFPRKWFPAMQDHPDAMKLIVGCGILGLALVAAVYSWVSVPSRQRQMVFICVAAILGLTLGLFTIFAGGFYFPGGLLIGGALTVNLLAAHTVRFTVQTRGLRLISGLVVIALGITTGVLIILLGHNQEGLRGEPPFSWMTLWWIIKGTVTLAWLACVVPAVFTTVNYFSEEVRNSKKFALMTVWGIAAAVLTAAVVFLWIIAPDWWVGEAAIRVLWRLAQGTIAALITMVGCILTFKKRAGIVLLHAGVGLLIFNELLVGFYNVENQIMIEEGKSSSFAISDQHVELAVVERDPSKDEEKVVAVPIAHNGSLTSLARDGAVIEHSELPFDIQVEKFYRNSQLTPLKKGETSEIKEGLGKFQKVKELDPFSGADSRTNIASAIVKFRDKDSGKILTTRLLSQQLSDLQRMSLQDEIPEQITVGGKTYDVFLRFKQIQKPYSIYLEDIRKVDYLGTATPKDYSSFIVFKDERRDSQHRHRIWMNNPMRYAGWTYYQSGYNGAVGNETTTLQVVKNRGWMIPYLACMVVVVGMAVHFVMTLIRFLTRMSLPVTTDDNAAGTQKGGHAVHAKPIPEDSLSAGMNLTNNKAPAWFCWGLPIAFVLLAVMFVAKYSAPPRTPEHEMNLYEFGKLPVVYRGRAKPFDSLARDNLRVISSKASYKDDSGETQPAIHWLIELISQSEDADKQRVFRITSLELLDALDLERRKGYRYSYSELKDHEEMISGDAQTAQEQNEQGEVLTGYQQSLIDLNSQLGRYKALRAGFRLPDEDADAFERLRYVWIGAAIGQQLTKRRVPFAIPVDAAEEEWLPLATAYHRVWLQDLAKESGAKSIEELMEDLAAAAIENREECFKAHADQFALEFTKDIIRRQNHSLQEREVDKLANEKLNDIEPEMKKVLDDTLKEMYLQRGGYEAEVRQIVQRTPELLDEQGLENVVTDKSKSDEAARTLASILVAYKEGNVERFNATVQKYEQLMRDKYKVYETDASKVKLEAFYNHSEWLLISWIFYITAFVLVALSWALAPVGWYRPLGRAALWLVIFVFALHTGALIMRMLISGRPPVTNLYSSAVFIAWGGVLIGLIVEVVFRRGIGVLLSSVTGISYIAIAIHGLANDGDTLGVMQAVLDTQFWLATHVVCITMGYATMFLAGKIGVAYVLLGMFTPALKARVHKNLTLGQVFTKLIYGIMCFALFFSFFGTVLGGLWGDDSWGRFWGWDPKENGALIIVIWSALVLHARWGRVVKDRGLAVLAIGGNIVTAWSWFGVNQLGIGLHSYGFTEGVLKLLGFFVLSQILVVLAGMLPLGLWRSFEEQHRNGDHGEIIDAQPT